MFLQTALTSAITTVETHVYNAKTGELMWEADSYGPVAVIDHKAFFVEDNFATQLDHSDWFVVNVYDLDTGKRLEHRTYSIKNRVRDRVWNSRVAVSGGALYISGGGNLACFAVAKRGGRANPDFIRVPKGEVRWVAGPYRETFLLE